MKMMGKTAKKGKKSELIMRKNINPSFVKPR